MLMDIYIDNFMLGLAEAAAHGQVFIPQVPYINLRQDLNFIRAVELKSQHII